MFCVMRVLGTLSAKSFIHFRACDANVLQSLLYLFPGSIANDSSASASTQSRCLRMQSGQYFSSSDRWSSNRINCFVISLRLNSAEFSRGLLLLLFRVISVNQVDNLISVF